MTEKSETNPLVSVIIPVFNSAPWLHTAVESILRQSYADIELIAVDDGSSDGSLEILRGFARQDCRVQVVSHAHAGIPRTRNVGLKHAKGQYVAWLDADDQSLSDRLALQVDHLARFPDCVAIGTQVFYVDPDGDPIGPVHAPCNHDEIDAQLLTGRGSALQQSTMMARKRVVESVGGYCEDLEICSDIDLCLKLAEQGQLANLPVVLGTRRRHVRSISAKQSQETMCSVREQIIRRALSRRGHPQSAFTELTYLNVPTSEYDLYRQWMRTAIKARYYETAAKYCRRLRARNSGDPSLWRRALSIRIRLLLAKCRGRVAKTSTFAMGPVHPVDEESKRFVARQYPVYPKLFIVGAHRSGTTWLRSVFECHPDVVAAHRESQVYTTFASRIARSGCRNKRVWQKLLDAYRRRRDADYSAGPHYLVDETAINKILQTVRKRVHENRSWTDEDASHDLARHVFDHFYSQNGGDGQKLFVEKTPAHVFYAEQILRYFPDAKLIHMLRDGRDVCVSLQMRALGKSNAPGWPPRDRRRQIEMWMNNVKAALDVSANPQFAGRVITVRYEDLKANPTKEFARIFRFTGLTYTTHDLIRIADATDFKNLPHTGPGKHRHKGTVGDWRNHFTNEDRELFKKMAGDLLLRCGYQLDDAAVAA